MAPNNTTINSRRPHRHRNNSSGGGNRSKRSTNINRRAHRRAENASAAPPSNPPHPPGPPGLHAPPPAGSASILQATDEPAAAESATDRPDGDDLSSASADRRNDDDDDDASLDEPAPPPPPEIDEERWPPPPPRPPDRTIPPAPANRPKSYPSYASALRHFMCYTNKLNYPRDWEFSVEELSPVTPEMVYAYMAFKVFGKEDPSPDDNPTKGMANTLLSIKKQVSYFMVDRVPSWDSSNRTGNPTKSAIVNDLISFVKKKETGKRGKKSRADRPAVSAADVGGAAEFSEVDPEPSDAGTGGGAAGGSGLPTEWRNFVTAKVCEIENGVRGLQSDRGGRYGEILKRLDKIERDMARMSAMPALRIGAVGATGGGAGGADETEVARPPNLCKCPKNLYVLWAEFESGVGGNKAARSFTPTERGKVKFKYCRRKIVWDAIDSLVKRGLSSDVAIDRIYAECGGPNTKVSDVIERLKHFRQTGNNALHMYVAA